MLRIPIAENEALLLTPRWQELAWPWSIAVPAAIALLPILLVVSLYIYELRLLSRPAALGLLSLRLLVVALLWFVACFQPVMAQYRYETINGNVLILVDRSQSMEIRDSPLTPLGKLRLAQALNIKSNGDSPPSEVLEQWMKHYEQNPNDVTPPWILPNEDIPQGNERDAVAAKRKSWHDAICKKVDSLTRSQITASLLEKNGVGLVDRLGEKHPIRMTAFNRSAWPVELPQWPKMFDSPKSDGKKTEDEAYATNIVKPLERILVQRDESTERVLGVILITDGRHNQETFRESLGHDFAGAEIPIYPIVIGTPNGPPDVEVLAVDAPSNVPKNTRVTVKPIIRINNVDHRKLSVELWRIGKTPKLLDKQPLTKNGNVKPFSVPLKKVGDHALAVKIAGAKNIKELNTHNNEKDFTVRVTDDKIRMLVVDGEARWEYHFLTQALKRDPNVDLELVLFEQPRIGVVPNAELKKIGHPTKELPKPDEQLQSDPLFQYDCIFLGDVSPEHLSSEDRKRLERYVAERGGSLILIAGKQHLPAKYFAPGKAVDPFVKLFPISKPVDFRPEWGFRFALNSDGKQMPFLQMETDPGANDKRWQAFRPHFFAAPGAIKPGAVSLVELKLAEPAKDKPPTGDVKNHGVLVHHTYGFGRVLYVGLDSTWRWRYRAGDRYHHRFWGQVARWAVKEEFYPAGNRFVRFGSGKRLYAWREKIELKLKFNEQLKSLPDDATVNATIYKQKEKEPREKTTTVKLKRDRFRHQFWQGDIQHLPPGDYQIALEVPLRKDNLPPQTPLTTPDGGDRFSVLPPIKDEVIQLAPDWQRMDALADDSEGRRYTPENAHELFTMFSQRIEQKEHKTEQRVWQDPPFVWILLGCLLGLLTAEWVGRKLAGLT